MVTKKKAEPTPDTEESTLARKYRPLTLDRIIGHEAAVTRMQGMINSDKIPNAIAIFGPTSVGKTTLARAFAAAVNGKPALQQTDYKEVNAASTKGIDDMRDLERLSKFRPMGKRRFLAVDEAQMLLTNQQAVNALLKPLEEPAKRTTWFVLSMEPAKFKTTEHGRAILNRCTQFVLQPHTDIDLMKQALRIAKGERMSYVLDEKRLILKKVVQASGGEMRTLANLIGGLQQFYDGLKVKPKLLKAEHLAETLSTVESADDVLAARLMVAVYTRQYGEVVKALLDVQDPFMFVKRCQWISSFMLNVKALDGAKHKKIWWSPANREVHTKTKSLGMTLGTLAHVNSVLVKCQTASSQITASVPDMLASDLYFLIKDMKP
jgi:DNA polymerase III delta prime subunit